MAYDPFRMGEVEQEPESMDALLQLVLPIVLILAYLMTADVNALRERLKVETAAKSPAEKQRDLAIIELQKQLLSRAVQEVMLREEQKIGLPDYERAVPTAAQILNGDINDKFTKISARLYQWANNVQVKRKVFLREDVLTQYKQLAAASGVLGNRDLSPENQTYLETELTGHIDELLARAVSIQAGLITQWAQEPAVTQLIREESKTWWGRVQGAAGKEKVERAVTSDEFTNLKVSSLQKKLLQMNAPLLDETVRRVKAAPLDGADRKEK